MVSHRGGAGALQAAHFAEAAAGFAGCLCSLVLGIIINACARASASVRSYFDWKISRARTQLSKRANDDDDDGADDDDDAGDRPA